MSQIVLPPNAASRPRALSLATEGITKIFGAMRALDDVSVQVDAGSFHALLGENGAGKSTLVKCIMGFYGADAGAVLLDGVRMSLHSPRQAQAQGIGMVYQHFTLVPCLTAAENLVMSRADAPGVINWRSEKRALEAFMDRMPFRVRLDSQVADLSAGEKQKLEILKLLYLDQRFLILDEPTSVMTPGEADEVLVPPAVGYLHQAQPVARGDEAHRLGVDGDGTGGEHALGEIFFVEIDSHMAKVLRRNGERTKGVWQGAWRRTRRRRACPKAGARRWPRCWPRARRGGWAVSSRPRRPLASASTRRAARGWRPSN